MKIITTFLLFLVFNFVSCQQKTTGNKDSSQLIIAIQPFDNFKQSTLNYLASEISKFYNCEVIILKFKNIPHQFFDNTKSPRYSADSLIRYLTPTKKDSFNYVLGITHSDIFTAKRDEKGDIKEPIEKYKVWGIFGLGYLPGKSCVISDNRLHCNDKEQEQKRLRNIALHEHCTDKNCIMTDANESIKTIDNESNNLCEKCRRKIMRAVI